MKNSAIEIVKILQNAGFESYWAGGCVRDMLMNITPKDYDIVTSATPDEVKRLMTNTYEVGRQFGVIVARMGEYNFEIATFRTESEYKDARHPETVFFTNAHDDAKRRDFTINGMFYDPIAKKIIDYVDGEKDIKEKIVKFIGNPNDRIKEDHLRILRAVRFKNTLGFTYDKRTWETICTNAYRIESVSNERIANELNKMFDCSNRAQALVDLSDSGLLTYVLPEIEKMKGVPQPDQFHHEGDVFTHTVWALKSLPDKCPLSLVWAVIFHDAGKVLTLTMPKTSTDRIRFNKHAKYSAGIATKICRRLKFPNVERELIVWLVKNHMIIGDIAKMNVVKRRKFLMDHRMSWLLELHKADALGSSPKDLTMYKDTLRFYDEAKKYYEDELNKPKFVPFVTGADLISHFDLEQGPEIGKILKKLEEAQLRDEVHNRNEALTMANKIINER